jgi:hypothetical protein
MTASYHSSAAKSLLFAKGLGSNQAYLAPKRSGGVRPLSHQVLTMIEQVSIGLCFLSRGRGFKHDRLPCLCFPEALLQLLRAGVVSEMEKSVTGYQQATPIESL